MTAHVRICKAHDRPCTEDEARDEVVCPEGPHVVRAGQWTIGQVADGQIQLAGPALIAARAKGALRSGSRDDAVRHLQALALRDDKLRAALVTWAAEAAIDRALGLVAPAAVPGAPETPDEDEDEAPPATTAARAPRVPAATAHAQRPDRATSDRGLQLVAQTNLRNLMGFTLPDGKELREATGAEIADAAITYADTARGSAVKARWLRLVGEAVPREKKAAWAITEVKLGALYGQAEQEMERLGELLGPRLPGARPALGGGR